MVITKIKTQMKTNTETNTDTETKKKTYCIEYSETVTYKEFIEAEDEDEANEKFFEDFNYEPLETSSNYLDITEVDDKEGEDNE